MEDSEVVVFALLTVKLTEFELPPPGDGFVTVTLTLPALAMSEARMAAVNCVALTNVVVRALPPKFTTEFATKPVPFTVKLNPAPPAVALVGEMLVIVGTGLFTMKLTAFDVPPPGLLTVTLTLPTVAMSEARMAAVTCVALTKVVTRALPPKLTTEFATKFVPFTVKSNPAPPAVALVGEMVVMLGPWATVWPQLENLNEPMRVFQLADCVVA